MRDRLLSMALLAYEDSMCPGCGQPKDVTFNPDADGWFEVQEITCAGCAAQQQHTKQHRSQKTERPGLKTFVIDTRPPDLELMPWRMPSRTGDEAPDKEADAE